MNGKGRGPEKGYNRQAYAENYDAIFRRTTQPITQQEPMKTNQEEPNPQPTVLPWLKEAIEEICLELPGGYDCDPQWVCDMLRSKGAAIIARHDPHAATLRLLREADEVLCDVSRYPVASAYPDGPCLERETHDNVCKLLIAIRAHLAAHSKPAAMQQSAKQEGSQ